MERTSSNAPGGLGHIDSFVRTWGVKMEPPAKDEFVMDKHIPTLVDPRHFQGAKIGLEMALPAIFALAFVMGTHQRLKNTGKQTCSSSSASGGNPSTHKNVLDSPVHGLDTALLRMVVDMCCVYPEVLGEQRSSHPVIVLTGGWDHKGLEGQSKVVGGPRYFWPGTDTPLPRQKVGQGGVPVKQARPRAAADQTCLMLGRGVRLASGGGACLNPRAEAEKLDVARAQLVPLEKRKLEMTIHISDYKKQKMQILEGFSPEQKSGLFEEMLDIEQWLLTQPAHAGVHITEVDIDSVVGVAVTRSMTRTESKSKK